jgi:hypothetical protein
MDVESGQAAIGADGHMLHDRPIKVSPKRTNVPGMKTRRRPNSRRWPPRFRGAFGGAPMMMMVMPSFGRGGNMFRPFRGRGRGRRGSLPRGAPFDPAPGMPPMGAPPPAVYPPAGQPGLFAPGV